MGKKRSKTRAQRRGGTQPQGHTYDEARRNPPLTPPPMSADEIQAKAKAVQRLKGALHAMSQPPEPILAMMERLGIGIREVNFTATFTPKDQPPILKGRYFLVSVEDLLKGEETNQEQGSIVKRLYGAEAEQEMMGNRRMADMQPGSPSNPLVPDDITGPNPLMHMTPAQQEQFKHILAQGVAAREAAARRRTVIDQDDLDTLRNTGGQQ